MELFDGKTSFVPLFIFVGEANADDHPSPRDPGGRKNRNRENSLEIGMASWRVHRGVEWCLYGPQTPRETRDTRIFRTTLHVRSAVNRAKRRPERPFGPLATYNSNNKNRRAFL